MYNIFRLAADFLHLSSILILLMKIISQKSCAGVSLKSHEIYALVFITRYLDLLTLSGGFYNIIFKIFFISSSVIIVYLIRYKYNRSYSKRLDTFRVVFLIAPSAVLALIFTDEYSLLEILWTFSIFLEAVASLPQLFLLQRSEGEIETLTSNYVITLGGYRALYLLNWIWRLITENHYRAWVVWMCGIIQTAIYSDFAYYYFKAKFEGKRLSLPK
ncbi:er lumen protein-retaining receptor [Anaeramoeba ignava]|uniref:Er lumen protein-retaining receptor n=1 Tax=Anaeramoeba ignava TaxID=1746090 RepID=A0A9Q0LHT0_ANAIG|nr:er lumen protein-retaining receptor [Anaeramoeba ignava]